jgi:hypothetical protein
MNINIRTTTKKTELENERSKYHTLKDAIGVAVIEWRLNNSNFLL